MAILFHFLNAICGWWVNALATPKLRTFYTAKRIIIFCVVRYTRRKVYCTKVRSGGGQHSEYHNRLPWRAQMVALRFSNSCRNEIDHHFHMVQQQCDPDHSFACKDLRCLSDHAFWVFCKGRGKWVYPGGTYTSANAAYWSVVGAAPRPAGGRTEFTKYDSLILHG